MHDIFVLRRFQAHAKSPPSRGCNPLPALHVQARLSTPVRFNHSGSFFSMVLPKRIPRHPVTICGQLDRAWNHRNQQAQALEQERDGKKHCELAPLSSFLRHDDVSFVAERDDGRIGGMLAAQDADDVAVARFRGTAVIAAEHALLLPWQSDCGRKAGSGTRTRTSHLRACRCHAVSLLCPPAFPAR